VYSLFEYTKKINVQQSTNTLSSSEFMTLKPSAAIQQQSASQVPVSIPTSASSAMKIASADTQVPVLQTNSRQRGHASSQLSSSQKTKRNRT